MSRLLRLSRRLGDCRKAIPCLVARNTCELVCVTHPNLRGDLRHHNPPLQSLSLIIPCWCHMWLRILGRRSRASHSSKVHRYPTTVARTERVTERVDTDVYTTCSEHYKPKEKHTEETEKRVLNTRAAANSELCVSRRFVRKRRFSVRNGWKRWKIFHLDLIFSRIWILGRFERENCLALRYTRTYTS